MSYPWISLSRTASQALALALAAQLVAPPIAGQGVPSAIEVVVLRGEGVSGRVRERSTQDPAVRVLDDKEAHVVGAAVVFTLPTEGATGVFGNGSKTLTVLTDSEGVAVAQGLHFNQVPGKVPVHVNVSYKGLTTRTNITQVVVAPPGYKPGGGGGKGKVIAIVAGLAAAGAGGAIFALRSSGKTSTPTTPAPPGIGITPGTGTLSPPH
jgi:hypothetical protein